MPDWLVWAILAVLLAVGEILTPGLFYLGPVALAAALASVAAALGAGWVVEVLVFLGGAAASLAILRPIAKAHLKMPPSIRTGAAALVGTKGVVVEQVNMHAGRVKIGGEVWTARPLDETDVLEPGTQVEVAEIKGASALVYR
jgi:membrane protein implicated in regulation of membrane protease activity